MPGEALRGLIGATLFLGAMPAGSQAPPPPPKAVEFFNPTLREHSVEAECGEGSASVAWTFDGQNATLRTFTLGGRSLSASQLAQIQTWMSEIGGDILIDLECNGDASGVAAGMRLINAQFAGSPMARMIRADLVDGALSEFARYNFDGKQILFPQTRSEVR